jgi:hypothetical protein
VKPWNVYAVFDNGTWRLVGSYKRQQEAINHKKMCDRLKKGLGDRFDPGVTGYVVEKDGR